MPSPFRVPILKVQFEVLAWRTSTHIIACCSHKYTHTHTRKYEYPNCTCGMYQGFIPLWMYVLVDVWMCAGIGVCVGVFMRRRIDVWICGCASVWKHGRANMWTSASARTRLHASRLARASDRSNRRKLIVLNRISSLSVAVSHSDQLDAAAILHVLTQPQSGGR